MRMYSAYSIGEDATHFTQYKYTHTDPDTFKVYAIVVDVEHIAPRQYGVLVLIFALIDTIARVFVRLPILVALARSGS